MANPEHVAILEQGVEVWNQWRVKHPDIRPDFENDSLRGFGDELRGVNFKKSNLRGVDIAHINLSGATFDEADLTFAFIAEAEFVGASLKGAYFNMSHVGTCDFSKTDLTKALIDGHFSDVSFKEAKFNNASFREAIFDKCDFKDAHLNEASMGGTIFVDIDLSVAKGLESVHHLGPSTIGFNTIFLSQGRIPEKFLREAGLPNSIIEQIPALIGSLEPIQYYSCFISYSNKDQAFANRLYADLQSKGIRCWFAPEDLKIGDKFWHRIDESIRLYDKLLVVLSQNSVESEWVEREVMSALEKEKQQKKLVLFPVTVDEAFKRTDAPWAADIRRSRHVGDFRNWKSHDEYQKALDRLLRDLKSEAQKMASQDGTINGS